MASESPHPPGAPLPELQFQHAEPAGPEGGTGPICVACKQPIGDQYYHAQGQVVCPLCAQRIQSGQQAAPPLSLLRAALYGGGAALGGCILYAVFVIATGFEFALMAILVGIMVGKAIRHASHGLGGRPQQILAVVLTYFAITASYIPVYLSHARRSAPEQAAQSAPSTEPKTVDPSSRPSATSFGAAIAMLLLIAAAAPFLQLGSGISGLISLFMIFIGLQRAWKLTGRTELLVMGPYQAMPAQ
jgi:hypothetical protein